MCLHLLTVVFRAVSHLEECSRDLWKCVKYNLGLWGVVPIDNDLDTIWFWGGMDYVAIPNV